MRLNKLYFLLAAMLFPTIAFAAPVCDGVRSTNGVTTSGSTTFTGSGFSAGSAGKRIVIKGAGTNKALATLAINAAGTGYLPGDTFTATGGTFTRPVIIRVEAIGSASGDISDFHVTDSGVYSATTGTLTQGSTLTEAGAAGGGSGATFTATWLSHSLSTTIATYVNSTTVTLTTAPGTTIASGATYVWGTDDATAMQTAINTGTYIPAAGICLHTAKLTVATGTSIIGKGDYNTRIAWVGTCDGTGIQMQANNGTLMYGLSIKNFLLDGMSCAGVGWDEHGVTSSDLDFSIENATRVGWNMDVGDDGSPGGQNARYYIQSSANDDLTSSFMDSFRGNSSVAATTINHAQFRYVRVVHRHGYGFNCAAMDSNQIEYLFGQIRSGGTGKSLNLAGSQVNPNHCHQLHVITSDLIGGTMSRGAGYTYPAQDNRIDYFNTWNGAPIPTIDPTSELSLCLSDRGKCSGWKQWVQSKSGTTVTVTVADTNKVLDNESYSTNRTWQLPSLATASSGQPYCFRNIPSAAVWTKVAADSTAGDVIEMGGETSAAGGNIQSTLYGSEVCLYSGATAGKWHVRNAIGQWQVN